LQKDDYSYYTWLLLISNLLDVISHTIKEAIVRNQPLNQEIFNFKISAFQFVIGILAIPLVKLTQYKS
jgi:hypothetical protein